MSYIMRKIQNIIKQNFLWRILLFGQLVLYYQCQDLQPSKPLPYCEQESETEQILRNIVREPDFCPWKKECNGSCDGTCTGGLRSIKGYCTSESVSAKETCMQGRCICTEPKLSCFRQPNCPCYTDDDNGDVISKEECCIHAIDCIMGSGKNTESKSCFIRPDDPSHTVQCQDLASICKVLEGYFCDNSCLTSTHMMPTIVPTRKVNLTQYTKIEDGTVTPQSRHSNLLYYIVGPILILIIVCAVIVTVHCVRKKKTNTPQPEEKVDDIDRYTTVDHPQRTECPPDVRDSNLDNPLYDMQVVGESATLDDNPTSSTRPTDLNDNTRSYENISPTLSSPSSSSSECDKLLPDSKTSTANSSSSKLGVPVFNALQNRQRGTRSRVTFLPRTPSPQLERKMLPGMTEEYEPVTVPLSPMDVESASSSTCDESIPMFEIKSQSIDSGYENATLTPDGKLKTKPRQDKSGHQNQNANMYDYANPMTKKFTADDLEYATPEVNNAGYNKLRSGNRQHDIPTGPNQYNKLDCSAGTIPTEEIDGEYSSLRREGGEVIKPKQALPDVIKVGQKHH